MEASRIIKAAIIGCGGIAKSKHMPGLATVKNVEMVAFCDVILDFFNDNQNGY